MHRDFIPVSCVEEITRGLNDEGVLLKSNDLVRSSATSCFLVLDMFPARTLPTRGVTTG